MVLRAVSLDRDGVINDNSNMVNQPEDLVLLPGVGYALKGLKQAGYLIFVVTNQGGIELGYFTEADLKAIHSHLEALLRKQGAVIDEIKFCPHFKQSFDAALILEQS
jgi:D-glycero-D-manno-heptose 1,7-bisphosphate phosphatase